MNEQNTPKIATQISLFGRVFTVSIPPSDEDNLKQSVALLTQRSEALIAAGVNDTQKMAILLALQMASDLLKVKTSTDTNSANASTMGELLNTLNQLNDDLNLAISKVSPDSPTMPSS
jgi:cell division protein ZapA (FtsZ GTPase activity inhibitor)